MRPPSDIERSLGDASRDDVYRAVCDYRYFAPAYLIMKERRRQDLAAADQASRPRAAGPDRSRCAEIVHALRSSVRASIPARRRQGAFHVQPRAEPLD